MGIDFFDYSKAIDNLDKCVAPRYLKRYYSEAVFLNSFYLDYFNSNRDIESIAVAYYMSVENCKALIDTSREIHQTIHETLNNIKASK